VVAIGGGHGTLTEIALALRLGRPVAAIRSWEVRPSGATGMDPGIHVASTAPDAVDWLFARIGTPTS